MHLRLLSHHITSLDWHRLSPTTGPTAEMIHQDGICDSVRVDHRRCEHTASTRRSPTGRVDVAQCSVCGIQDASPAVVRRWPSEGSCCGRRGSEWCPSAVTTRSVRRREDAPVGTARECSSSAVCERVRCLLICHKTCWRAEKVKRPRFRASGRVWCVSRSSGGAALL
jgi:hypothetical protein